MTDTMTLSKLIILYMLDKVDFSLTNSQISEFILDKGYVNYFTLQKAFNELIDADFIRMYTVRNSSHYRITDDGRDSLNYFGNQISSAIIKDVDDFLAKGKFTLRKENDITAEYYKDTADTYIVHCQIRERDELIAELNISVTSEQQAITLCDNWTKKNEEVYQFLVDNLFFKN